MQMKMAMAIAATVLCTGCAMNTPRVAAVPPPPAPTADPPALIFPQTALELPEPQPVPPEAIPKRELPVQPAVVDPPPVRSAPRRPVSNAKREPETEPASPPVAEPAKPATRTPLVPIDANLPNSDMIQKRIDALKGMQSRLANKTGGDAEMIRSRILYFIDQASKALARKDLRQADSLVSRAQVLAEDLLNVR